MSESEVMLFIESKVSELINKHMEEMYAKGGYRPPHALPKETKGDPNDIDF